MTLKTRLWTVLFLIVNYGLDRLTKIWAVATLKGQPAQHFWGDLMIWTYAENNGAFLSMGNSWPFWLKQVIFVFLPLLACIWGTWYALVKTRSFAMAFSIAAIIGGGLGNLQDRIFNQGYVIDFLNFGIGSLRTGVLNVGDMSITFAAIFILIMEWRKDRQEAAEKP